MDDPERREAGVAMWEQSEVTAVERYRLHRTPEAGERLVDEIIGDGAEFLDLPMTTRLTFELNPEGHALTDEGEELRDMYDRGAQAKKRRAMRDPRFWPEYYRARYEADEQKLFEDEVVPSPVYNMLLTFTPYAQDMEDANGPRFMDEHTTFQRDRKLGMMRFLYQLEPNKIEVTTISVENSHHLEAFRGVAAEYGWEIPEDITPTDMLGHHLPGYVEPKERLKLEAQLVNQYDKNLGQLVGGEFKQGREKGKPSVESYSFVVANQDILAVYAEEMKRLADTNLTGLALRDKVRVVRYSYLAKLHERYQRYDDSQPLLVRTISSAQEYDAAYDDMMQAGIRAALRGMRILGCGTALDPETLLAKLSEEEAEKIIKAEETKEDKECFYVSKKCPLCNIANVLTHETKSRIKCMTCHGSVKKTPQPAAA